MPGYFYRLHIYLQETQITDLIFSAINFRVCLALMCESMPQFLRPFGYNNTPHHIAAGQEPINSIRTSVFYQLLCFLRMISSNRSNLPATSIGCRSISGFAG